MPAHRKDDSVRALSELTGVPRATVHRFMNGEKASLDTARAMLPALEICPCCDKPIDRLPDIEAGFRAGIECSKNVKIKGPEDIDKLWLWSRVRADAEKGTTS